MKSRKMFGMRISPLRKAADIIKEGGLVVFPTDTVYGIGCNPFNEEAMDRLFHVKKRDRDKPIPILVSSIKKAEEIAEFGSLAKKIARRYWPGALTLVLPAKAKTPPMLRGPGNTVGIRIPNHPFALSLIKAVDGYLTGTSANLSGKEPACTAKEAKKQLGNKVDFVIDAGRCPIGISSTVVEVTSNRPKVLRQGAVKLEIQ